MNGRGYLSEQALHAGDLVAEDPPAAVVRAGSQLLAVEDQKPVDRALYPKRAIAGIVQDGHARRIGSQPRAHACASAELRRYLKVTLAAASSRYVASRAGCHLPPFRYSVSTRKLPSGANSLVPRTSVTPPASPDTFSFVRTLPSRTPSSRSSRPGSREIVVHDRFFLRVERHDRLAAVLAVVDQRRMCTAMPLSARSKRATSTLRLSA